MLRWGKFTSDQQLSLSKCLVLIKLSNENGANLDSLAMRTNAPEKKKDKNSSVPQLQLDAISIA